jgi:hypothetical protein
MREVGSGANQEDSVAVDQTRYRRNVDLIGRRGTCDQVDLDLEVSACFVEGSMRCFREDPKADLAVELRQNAK